MVRRILKIIAGILTAQIVIGFAIGLAVPWFGFLALKIDDIQKLMTWTAATVMPAAVLVDVLLFVGAGAWAWRKWSKL